MRIFLSGLLFVVLVQRPASFDVATIKRAVPSAASGEDGRNGVLKMWNVSLKRCIGYAYNIPEDQILGGPKWIDELRYDILAKVDHSVDEPELLKMLQPLLADRFKLKLHQETRLMPGYILTVAKGGIKATVADPNRHSGGNGGRGFIDSRAGQLSGLTIRLTTLLGRPVLDMTGDKRKFDFHLQWNPEETLPGGGSASDYPSLITALQEQLGLKLESKKVNADILVVDQAELPSEN
jgi:uncharacterized protein (TIGR03435 family)